MVWASGSEWPAIDSGQATISEGAHNVRRQVCVIGVGRADRNWGKSLVTRRYTMKKYAFLLLVVLGISSTAFGFCRMSIQVNEQPIECGATSIDVSGYLCCTQAWQLINYEEDVRICRFGRVIYVDIDLDCECGCELDCQEGRATLDIPEPALCPGMYILVVRVWCNYEGSQCWPCWWYPQRMFVGQAATSFRVSCGDCELCAPCWPCWPCRPCPCPSPANAD